MRGATTELTIYSQQRMIVDSQLDPTQYIR